MQSLHRSRKTKYGVLLTIGVVTILWWNPLHVTDVARATVQWALRPVLRLGYVAGHKVHNVTTLFLQIGTLYDENQQLHARVRALEAAQARADELLRDNTSLREELRVAQRRSFFATAANVILRDTGGGSRWIVIDKGTDDGITLGAPVIVGGDILVGRVAEVFAHTARVDLLTDPSSVVNVTGARGGAEAIVRGNHGLALVVEDLPKDGEVSDGEMFVTSRISDQTPPGLAVGTIHAVAPTSDGLFRTGVLSPLITARDITIVFVVM